MGMIDRLILFRIGREGQERARKGHGTVGRTFPLASILEALWEAGEVPRIVSLDRRTVTVAIHRQAGPELSPNQGND